jgi:hypothetical protein
VKGFVTAYAITIFEGTLLHCYKDKRSEARAVIEHRQDKEEYV